MSFILFSSIQKIINIPNGLITKILYFCRPKKDVFFTGIIINIII